MEDNEKDAGKKQKHTVSGPLRRREGKGGGGRLPVSGLREGQRRHQWRQAPPEDQQSAVRMVHSNVDGERNPHQAGQGGGEEVPSPAAADR